jgi:hypothetical protein
MREVNMRLSGEKLRARVLEVTGNLRLWSGWRVAGSNISTAVVEIEAIAMNLPHDDHSTFLILNRGVANVILESHNAGTPLIALTKGSECDSYSFRTIDSLGVNSIAE